jgi:hypothetical protein
MNESEHISILNEHLPKQKMSLLKKVLIIFGVLCAIPLLLIGLFLYSLTTLDSEQEVTEKITLDSEWIKITPKKPLKPEKQTQEIVLDVDPIEGLVRNNSDLEHIRLGNGAIVNPEIQIVDQYGNVYTSDDILRYPTPSLYGNGISCQFYNPRLPQDRVYTEVRVKCDKSLRLSRIVWHCHTGK